MGARALKARYGHAQARQVKTSELRPVKTSELRKGDIVHRHGMRLLIDQPIVSWPAWNGDTLPVYATDALVLNPEERSPVISRGWLRSSKWEGDRWTIQGNDRATWYREPRRGRRGAK